MLECVSNIIRALGMGSCLSSESRSPLPGSPSSPGHGSRRRKNSKKRMGSRSSSFNRFREEHVRDTPGRMFSNGSSEIASLFTQQGKKGTNQDAMVVWEVISFYLRLSIVLFILCVFWYSSICRFLYKVHKLELWICDIRI